MSWIKIPQNVESLEAIRRVTSSKLEAQPTKKPSDEKSDDTKSVEVKLHVGRFTAGRVGKKPKTGKNATPLIVPLFPYIRRQILRFRTTAAVAGTTGLITVDDILGAIGVVGRVANTSVTCLATSFRMRRVSIYIGPGSAGVANAAVQWYEAGNAGEPDYQTDSSIPIDFQGMPSVITSIPPKNSAVGFWFRDTVDGTSPVFLLTASSTGCVVELELDWTLPTAVASSNAITVSTAVVGTFYRLGLNKTNASSNLMTPIGYPTTT